MTKPIDHLTYQAACDRCGADIGERPQYRCFVNIEPDLCASCWSALADWFGSRTTWDIHNATEVRFRKP